MLDRPERSWKTVASRIRISENESGVLAYATHALAPTEGLPLIRVSYSEGIAAFAARKDSGTVLQIYDSGLGKTIEIASIPEALTKQRLEISKVNGLRGVLVSLGDLAFVYESRSGFASPVRIAAKSIQDLIFIDNRGNQIYHNSGQIIRTDAGGNRRVIWPSAN